MYWLIVPVVLALLSAAWYPYQSKNTETSQVSLSSILSSPEVLEALSGDPAMLNEQRIKRDRTLFDVVDLPGKGKGAIAVRDILQGELIMQEKPLLTVPVGEITRKQIDTLYTVASAEQISSLLALSWSELKTDKEINLDPATQNEEERYILTEGIIQNNAFGLKIGNEQHLGVCPRMARINHNCASAHNCAYHYRESEGEMRAYAIKNISKGEELSYAYVETRKPRAERQYVISCITID
ncbi:hypothetical protein DL96DRAFT_1458918 [Flagelloscypha sp. PMI_526]|nr:hypothetical protein DL96DRAFT_1458918 [Flagelloscypha sp. PMI_526]